MKNRSVGTRFIAPSLMNQAPTTLKENDMKKNAIVMVIILLFASFVSANTRGLEKYAPQYSYIVIGADFVQLHDNEIFRSMEEKDQIWSYEDEDSEIGNYFRILKIDPKT